MGPARHLLGKASLPWEGHAGIDGLTAPLDVSPGISVAILGPHRKWVQRRKEPAPLRHHRAYGQRRPGACLTLTSSCGDNRFLYHISQCKASFSVTCSWSHLIQSYR